MKKLYYCIPILFLFVSCKMDLPPEAGEQIPTRTLRLYTSSEATDLRAFIGGEEMTLFGSESNATWERKALLNGREWVLDKPYEVTGKGQFFGIVSPPGGRPLLRNEYGAVRVDLPPIDTSGEDGYLYTIADYSPDNSLVSLVFKRLSMRLAITLDLSDYHGAMHIDQVTVLGVPHTAWVNPQSGLLTRPNEAEPFTVRIDKTVSGKEYSFSIDTFPGETNNAPILDVTIDEHTYRVALMSSADRPWYAGEVIRHRVKVSDYGAKVDPSDLADGDRTSDKIDLIDDFDAPFFTATVTDQVWRMLYCNHAALINVFVVNHSGKDFVGDVRWVLEREDGTIAQQGIYFEDFSIEKEKYEGLPLPIRPTVKPGKYRLRLLMRESGEKQWFRPFVASDSDRDEDWLVTVTDRPEVLLTAFGIEGEDRPGYGTVNRLSYDKPYRASLSYNSYHKEAVPATVRLYYARDLRFIGHSLVRDDYGTWHDLLCSREVTIDPEGGVISLPFSITERRANPNRFGGYLYATIQYAGEEEEYPLLSDRNALYRMCGSVRKAFGDDLTLGKLLSGITCVPSCVVVLE
jgi:hypothetical protein